VTRVLVQVVAAGCPARCIVEGRSAGVQGPGEAPGLDPG